MVLGVVLERKGPIRPAFAQETMTEWVGKVSGNEQQRAGCRQREVQRSFASLRMTTLGENRMTRTWGEPDDKDLGRTGRQELRENRMTTLGENSLGRG